MTQRHTNYLIRGSSKVFMVNINFNIISWKVETPRKFRYGVVVNSHSERCNPIKLPTSVPGSSRIRRLTKTLVKFISSPPNFWGKNACAVRLNVCFWLKTMLALTISETNYRLLVYDVKIRSIFKNYPLISWDAARYDCSFLSSHLLNPNDYTLREEIFSSTVVKDDAAVFRFQYGE